MNSSERTKILKKIKLPDIFIKKGGLAHYLVKEKDLIILVGVYVDSNMDKESFFIQYFIQPMFVLFPTYVFSIGHRVGGYWSKQDIKKIENELSNFTELKSFDDIKKILETTFGESENLYKHQFLGYIYVLLNEVKLAKKELQKVIKQKSNDNPQWKVEEIKRVEDFLLLLNTSDYIKAKNKLFEWQAITMRNLALS